MTLKNLLNKNFMISKDAHIGMFAASVCYGLKKSKDGILFIGLSYLDNEVYAAVMTKEYLEELLDDKTMIAISDKDHMKTIIEAIFHKGINEDSFKYVGLI